MNFILGLSLNHPSISLITEQEKLVIVKQMVVKYKAGTSFNRQGSEAEKLLKRIFKVRQDSIALQDALSVAEVMKGIEKKDAMILYIEKLIECDESKEALKHLGNIKDSSEVFPIVEMILIKAENAKQVDESMVLFLRGALILMKKLDSINNCFEERINTVKNNFKLNESYGITDSCQIKDYIKKSLEKGDQDIKQLCGSLKHISKLLNISVDPLFNQLLEELFERKEINDIINSLNRFPEDFVNKGTIEIMLSKINSSRLIPSVRNICSSYINYCDEIDLNEFIVISSWIQFIEDLKDDSSMFDNTELDLVKHKISGCNFKDKGLPIDDELVLEQPLQIFQMQQKIKDMVEDMNISLNSSLTVTGDTEDIIKNENISEFVTKITTFCYALLSKNQTYLAYKAVKQIEWMFIANTKISEMIRPLHQELTPKLLIKMLTDKKPDLPLALAFLSGQSKSKTSLSVLSQLNSRLGNDNVRLGNLARLGWRYCSKMNLYNEKEQFNRLLINAAWARKLGLNGIELALIANGSPEHLNILGTLCYCSTSIRTPIVL